MDAAPTPPRKNADISFLERKIRSLALRRISSDSPADTIGDLGLNLLHEPSECHVDFVFVHGLRGGSRKTWSATPNPAHYWPKEWLPADPDFRNVRIHSFGYNSDWMDRRENLLNIHDFGQSLMEEIQSSPSMRRNKNTRIVFIGHSMGGLVIKKACILSKENPAFNELGTRIHSIYFLATPHRGSDLAHILDNILKALPTGNKPFLGNLKRGSETINLLNDQFRHVCSGVEIHSFTESIPTNLGPARSALVVDKQSATLGYPDERIQSLNADHRGVSKFQTPNDSNFRTLRNHLAATVEDIERSAPKSMHLTYREDMQTLSKYLNISSSPIHDLSLLEDARVPGSCEWLTTNRTFLDWQYSKDSARYLWLTGQPGTGKSVITAHVIGCLDETSRSYYFFKHGDESRSTLSGLLLSIAYQMAQNSHQVRDVLLALLRDDSVLDRNDHRSIWRRIFVGGIFRADFASTQYWVIDALDECCAGQNSGFDNFFTILAKLDHAFPLKVFISSRFSVDLERLFAKLLSVHLQLSVEDSNRDIRIFVETNAEDLPAGDAESREALIETVVRKSGGNFLWTVLVMRQLQDAYTSEEIEEILLEMPEEMDDLYARNLQLMESRPRTKKLAQTVLTWTLCAARSLTVEELKSAILLDLQAVVARDLERSISTLCGQFVFVDKHSRVNIVHETARTFLLNANLDSDFRISVPLGNVQLGLACLEYLTSDEEVSLSRKRKGSANIPREPSKHALASYACLEFSEHLARSNSSSDQLFLALIKFLQGNILVWIERMAEENHLDCLMRTAKHLKAYQARREKHTAPLEDDISSWATDLPRIVAEFGTNLSKYPAAIHDLIPPLCPQSSRIHHQFGSSNNGLQLRGLSNADWNDRISSWNYDKNARCIASQDQWFAIGLSDGMISVHWTSTCQAAIQMDHGEPVRMLRFGNLNKLLASTGPKRIKMWDVSTGAQLWEQGLESDPLAVDFDDDDKRIVVATRSKELLIWLTGDGSLLLCDHWNHKLPYDYRHAISRAPVAVAISASHKLMAIVYRYLPLCLWDLDAQQPLGFCSKTVEDCRDGSNNIISLCFNPVQALSLLAVAYMDGDVALFDTVSRTMKCHARIDTQVLAVSPDGRTLAGGDSNGTIKLFDFETLRLLYCATLSDNGIAALTFTGDSLRLIDCRGAQVNVWEPSALVRKWEYSEDNRGDCSSEAPGTVSQGVGMSAADEIGAITDLKTAYAGTLAICGRNSGSVDIYDLTSNEPSFKNLYRNKGASISILTLDWNESHNIVASLDASSRFRVMRLSKDDQGIVTVCEDLLDAQMSFGHLVNQLLISQDGTRLLVSSSTGDFVWSLQTRNLVASRETEPRTNWRWFVHPQEISKVLLLENSTLKFFSWEASGTFPIVSMATITTGDLRPLDLQNIVVDKIHTNMIMKLSPTPQGTQKSYIPLRNGKETSLFTLSLSASGAQELPLLPEPLLPLAGDVDIPKTYILLGIVPGAFGGHLLVFIADGGWICTFDLDHGTLHPTFQRHFFIPSAWLSTSDKIISVVTEKRDILFVRGHEVAIIKRGLEASRPYDVIPK